MPAVACAIGFVIAYIDSRPNWDDTGVTAGALFLVAAVCGAMRPRTFWISGLAIGLPVWGMNVIVRNNHGAILAVIVALIGAVVGAVIGKLAGVGSARVGA
jgi:hypothetical protein